MSYRTKQGHHMMPAQEGVHCILETYWRDEGIKSSRWGVVRGCMWGRESHETWEKNVNVMCWGGHVIYKKEEGLLYRRGPRTPGRENGQHVVQMEEIGLGVTSVEESVHDT